MTSTTNRAGRALGTAVSGARSASSEPLRAAGRQLLATAGNQVLKAAVDRAVGKVDTVAGRLDAVASGEHKPRPPAKRKPPERPAGQRVRETAAVVKVRVGAALNLVVQQALRLLQLIQRLAQQLLATLARLLQRGDETGRPTDAQGVARTAPRKRPDQSGRPGGQSPEHPRPAAGQPARAPQAPRRQRPRPAARDAAGAPRRVAGDRPVRVARND
jgi:hypothetical protein